MHAKNFADAADLSRKLAADNERVRRFIDHLPEPVEQLVQSTVRQDWESVRRTSDELAEKSESFGIRDLADSADQVVNETFKPNNSVGILRGVMRLVGECGVIRRP